MKLENGQIITYRYNGDGILYEREFNGTRTRYYYDGNQLLAEATITNNTPQLKARYIRGTDFTELLSLELANGTKGYYVQERHGDIIGVEGEAGNVLNTYTYDIWGNHLSKSETIANPFRYAGEWVEEKTNLQYLRARWYEPKLGRFISEDPVEGQFTEPLSLNRYTYAENNPLKYVDPSGNAAETPLDAAVFIYDVIKLLMEPSKENKWNAGYSLAALVVPGVNSTAVKAVVNALKGIDNVIIGGRVTVNSIKSNPTIFSGKNANEIAEILKSQGYDVTVQNSSKSNSGAIIITINNAGNGRNITQVQVSPGGGRHGSNSYIKISTSDQGIIKIVDGTQDTYKTDGKEKATIIFTGK